MLLRVAACALILSATLAAQQTPVFKSSVTLVTVDVTVLDKDGRPVPGLSADDFQIKLNGRPEAVRAMSYVTVAEKAAPLTVRDIPAEVTGRRVVSNDAPKGEQKVFVIAIDDLSFAPEGGKRTLEAAKHFVETQRADDYIGLTTTTGAPIVNPTLDHASVVAALKRVAGDFVDPRRPMVPGGPTVGIAEAIAIIDQNDATALANMIRRECGGDQRNKIDQLLANRCSNVAQSVSRLVASTMHGIAGRQIAALTAALNAMKGASGLKQLVLMSEGIGNSRDAVQMLDPIARAAAAANVQISILMEDSDEIGVSEMGRAASETGTLQTDTGLSNRLREDKGMMRSALETLADLTGGTFESVSGQADQAFERAAVAGSAVYRIGVEAPPDATLAKPMAVTASVRKPGLAVHANRQAVLPGPAAQPSAAELVASAIKEGQPLFNVPIRLAVARRRASGGQVELGVGMEVPSSVKGPLAMTFGLVDQKGELRQGSRPLAVSPNADYRLTFPMPVAPGKYSLRFAVTDATGSVGSLETSIDAKLMAMGTLTASDVLTWWTDSSGKAQFLALDEVPAGVANLGAGIELYPQPGTNFPENVKVKMSLVSTEKNAATAAIEKDVAPLVGDNMLRAEAMLPLANVPAGSYILRASVTVAGKLIGEATALIKKK